MELHFPFPPSLLEEKWDFYENALCCICHHYNYSVDKGLEGKKGSEEKHWKDCTLLHPFKIDLNREQIIREAFFSTKIIQERSPYDLYMCLCACVCANAQNNHCVSTLCVWWHLYACSFMCVCFLLQGGITFAFTAVLSRLYKKLSVSRAVMQFWVTIPKPHKTARLTTQPCKHRLTLPCKLLCSGISRLFRPCQKYSIRTRLWKRSQDTGTCSAHTHVPTKHTHCTHPPPSHSVKPWNSSTAKALQELQMGIRINLLLHPCRGIKSER